MSTSVERVQPRGAAFRLSSARHQRWLYGYAFIAPALLVLTVFVLLPIVVAIYLSFTTYNLIEAPRWAGLDNYRQLAADGLFRKTLVTTTIYAVGSIALGLGGALGVALLLNRRLPGITGFKILYFLPTIASEAVMAVVFLWMYQDQGTLNGLLTALGLPTVGWLRSGRMALLSIIVYGAWRGLSYNTPIFLAALKNVSQELYEAAQIDGANSWAQFRFVTIPGIMPIVIYTVIMSTIASFQVVAVVDLMTDGGPQYATEVTIRYIAFTASESLKIGYASAMSVAVLGLLLVVTYFQMRLSPED
ncbi:MAG TPA: sugar ABC transporter permease [Herpetosiphonaceae bacterium]